MSGRAARALIAIGLAAVLLAASLASSASAQPRRLPQDFFAVGAGWMNDLALDGDERALEMHARKMRRLGINSARLVADWEAAEFRRLLGDRWFDFTILDRAVRALARFEIRPALLLIGTPTWERGSSGTTCGYKTTPPDDGFANFARAVTSRYGRSGDFWEENPALPYMPVRQYEVWNEENWLGYWCPSINPARYARLFLATGRAVHAVDPKATVMVGGLVGLREDKYESELVMHGMQSLKYLSQMLASEPGVRSQIDAIGFHSYAIWPIQNLHLVRWFRRGLHELGLGRTPIAYNEFGWPTRGGDARAGSEARRSRFVSRLSTWIARSDCGISQIAPHTWATAEQDPDDVEDWFGIVDPLTGRPHDAARAYSRVALRFEGRLRKPPPRRLAICGG